MLNNYIRGGQIFLHKIRMLRQVWVKSLLTAFILAAILTSMFSYKTLMKLDYQSGSTYMRAWVSNYIHREIFPNSPPPTITAITKIGVFQENIKAIDVIKHIGFFKNYNEIKNSYYSALKLLLGIMGGFFAVIILLWARFGALAGGKDITKGNKIFNAKEVAKILNKMNKASDFVVADMPLVKDKETSHILITGTTGSGKSNCMHNILPQVRTKNQSAVIVDFTGEMVAKYYDAARGDIILCPFDERSHTWDFWKEVTDDSMHVSQTNLEIVSKSLFARDQDHLDPFWHQSAEVIFQDVVTYMFNKRIFDFETLNSMLSKEEIRNLSKKLQDTYSSPYLDPKNEKTAASIRSTLATSVKPLRYLEEVDNSKKICLKDWVSQVEGENEGKWLFLLASPDNRELMKPLVSIWVDIIVNKIMNLGVSYDRRIWLVIDELPALKKLPSLPTALSEFRKYGGCIMAGIQSVNQLYKIYGQHDGLSMLDQFNTKFIFRTEENNFASYICKNFGEIEYSESNENTSYGAHEMRDGVSFSKVEKRRPLATPSDLAALEDCEAFVKLPEPAVRVARVKMKYTGGTQLKAGFVPKAVPANEIQ